MFPITSIVVAAHIDDLLAESAAERLAKSAKDSSRVNPFASALNSVWSIHRVRCDCPGPNASICIRSRPDRACSATSSASPGSARNDGWSILTGPADRSAAVPKLTDYPFRS